MVGIYLTMNWQKGDSSMRKRQALALMCLICMLLLSATCFAADNFQKIYDENLGMQDLAQDEAVSETFTLNEGTLTIQIRKLRQEGDDKKYHFIVKLNNERIYDVHYPTVQGGYNIQVFKNTATNELFFALNTKNRSYLSGYSSSRGKYVLYADSMNYYNSFAAAPTFTVLKTGELVLAFVSPNLSQPYYHAYRFDWDRDAQWFSYRDIGTFYEHLKVDSQ